MYVLWRQFFCLSDIKVGLVVYPADLHNMVVPINQTGSQVFTVVKKEELPVKDNPYTSEIVLECFQLPLIYSITSKFYSCSDSSVL